MRPRGGARRRGAGAVRYCCRRRCAGCRSSIRARRPAERRAGVRRVLPPPATARQRRRRGSNKRARRRGAARCGSGPCGARCTRLHRLQLRRRRRAVARADALAARREQERGGAGDGAALQRADRGPARARGQLLDTLRRRGGGGGSGGFSAARRAPLRLHCLLRVAGASLLATLPQEQQRCGAPRGRPPSPRTPPRAPPAAACPRAASLPGRPRSSKSGAPSRRGLPAGAGVGREVSFGCAGERQRAPRRAAAASGRRCCYGGINPRKVVSTLAVRPRRRWAGAGWPGCTSSEGGRGPPQSFGNCESKPTAPLWSLVEPQRVICDPVGPPRPQPPPSHASDAVGTLKIEPWCGAGPWRRTASGLDLRARACHPRRHLGGWRGRAWML